MPFPRFPRAIPLGGVASARLETNRRDRQTAQPRHELGPTGRVIAHRDASLFRQHHDVEAIFRHIDSAKREHSRLRTPSLLMRARAQATVRVWKKRPELQAHSRFESQDGCGLPVATGALS
jgi:hypothetical protein